ncbi:MAG: hypothetical protein LBT32_10030 [Peptococcaceae bacterium]|jgi:transcriptional pleiotropic regulator of transition state genes|nr:hypothetical protein [Peptococcaceae bacterium]
MLCHQGTLPPTAAPASKQVIFLIPGLRRKKPNACIFCGQKLTIQLFKGQQVCRACLEDIPTLFSISS